MSKDDQKILNQFEERLRILEDRVEADENRISNIEGFEKIEMDLLKSIIETQNKMAALQTYCLKQGIKVG